MEASVPKKIFYRRLRRTVQTIAIARLPLVAPPLERSERIRAGSDLPAAPRPEQDQRTKARVTRFLAALELLFGYKMAAVCT